MKLSFKLQEVIVQRFRSKLFVLGVPFTDGHAQKSAFFAALEGGFDKTLVRPCSVS